MAILTETLDGYVEKVILAELDTAATLVPDTANSDDALAVLEAAHAELDDFRLDTRLGNDSAANGTSGWMCTSQRAGGRDSAWGALDDLAGIASSEGLAREHYLALRTDERREVLGGFLDAVFVRRSRGKGRNVDATTDRTRILWRGEALADLPRQRVVNDIRPFDFGESNVEAGVAAT